MNAKCVKYTGIMAIISLIVLLASLVVIYIRLENKYVIMNANNFSIKSQPQLVTTAAFSFGRKKVEGAQVQNIGDYMAGTPTAVTENLNIRGLKLVRSYPEKNEYIYTIVFNDDVQDVIKGRRLIVFGTLANAEVYLSEHDSDKRVYDLVIKPVQEGLKIKESSMLVLTVYVIPD